MTKSEVGKSTALGVLVALLLAFSFPAEAQQTTKVPRIGFLIAPSPSNSPGRIEAFRQGLRELGYVEGKNILIEWRSAEGKLDRLPALAAELVSASQGRRHCHGWSDNNTSCQRSNCHDSDCHGVS